MNIPADGQWLPAEDTVAICGPKSSAVTARAMESDPFLRFTPDPSGSWRLHERDGSATYSSGLDSSIRRNVDVAYVGRLRVGDGSMLVIAGVHAIGSLGAVHFLVRHLPDLYLQVGTARFSMAVESEFDGESITRSEVLCPPRLHP